METFNKETDLSVFSIQAVADFRFDSFRLEHFVTYKSMFP